MAHVRVWSALSDEELEASLLRGTAEQSAYLATWLEALGEFDRRQLWLRAGFASCAAWLMARCGSSSRAARDHVSVAARLEDAPLVAAALAEGRLSFSKVRALCRVVKPDNEEFLLGLAMDMTAAQLERHVRTYELHAPAADRPGRARPAGEVRRVDVDRPRGAGAPRGGVAAGGRSRHRPRHRVRDRAALQGAPGSGQGRSGRGARRRGAAEARRQGTAVRGAELGVQAGVDQRRAGSVGGADRTIRS